MVLSLADVLLEDKLSEPLRKEIHSQLDRRITQSYFDSTLGIDTIGNSWIRKLSNWNAVCTSGSLFTILTQADSKEDRAAAIGCAINSMKYYLSGFGEDGYCSEESAIGDMVSDIICIWHRCCPIIRTEKSTCSDLTIMRN